MKKHKMLKSIHTGIIPTVVLLFIFNYSFFINNCFSQWLQQQTNTTQTLRDIEFINRYTGWVCGDGTILKTTNSGLNWNEQTHPATNRLLYNIHPVNSNLAYCVGESKTILKTTNGGVNWFSIWHDTTGQHLGYDAVFFINDNTGWIGGWNHVLKTTNGGNNFDSIRVSSGILFDLYFKDINNGIGVGWIATTFKTTNGGINWTIKQLGYFYQSPLLKVTFINDFTGWVARGGSIYKTTNFGTDWDSISNIEEFYASYCIEFSSTSIGWVGGKDELQNGALFKSADGGFHWRRENLTTGFIYDIYSYNDTIVWVTGEQGKIWYTITGGQVNIKNIGNEIPKIFKLFQNYPNPFNPVTNVKFDIPKSSFVKIIIFDLLGKEITTLVNEELTAGSYEVDWDASDYPSGVYFYRLETDSFLETKKMLLIK